MPPVPVMSTKPLPPGRKGTWSLPMRKPTLPPLQESNAEEEDYPAFESHEPLKRSLLSRIFSIKPLSKVIRTTLPAERLRREILELLRRWESMGIGIAMVAEDSRTRVIRAKLQSHNSVGLKAMKFQVKVITIGPTTSNAIFSQEKGLFVILVKG